MNLVSHEPYQEPKVVGWSKKQVQDFASNVAKGLGYAPQGDLENVVRRLGGKVVAGDLFETADTGSIVVEGPKDFTIYINPLSGKRRSRFTIAHELGHYILHSRLGQTRIRVPRDGSGQAEWEANWFAAGFLMPEEEFRQKQQEGWGKAMLAMYFDVSEAAIEVRRQSLDA